MRVIPLTHDRTHLWDQFVESHEDATVYHLSGWKTVFESVFGYRPFYFMALNSKEEPEGILPMFQMVDIFRRKYLISNPFSNFAGICSKNQEAELSLLNKAIESAKQEKARYVEFRQLGTKISNDLPVKESFVTLMLKLPDDPELVWKAFSSKDRNKIRKAEKSGLKADFGLRYLKDFYSIYAKNMRHLGTPVLPFTLFKVIAEEFANRVDLLVLKFEGKPVSGMFLFKFKNILSEPWAASLREYNKLKVNNLLYWQAINYACKNGFEMLDFGRSTLNSGTDIFKRQWGAEPVQLHYQYYLNKAKEIPIVDALDNRYQKIIDIWKRLPLVFTNFAGPKVVQFLPEL